ncbi:diaminopimelate epimerase [Clostridium sp. CCUG 7971]|uniref:diaminopimelate epimerase n=1 Tax=Clostridium sp. CCUG 7971 TaxID=2811414 RepID=UPI001ABAAE78|nr:diaminopimelate epimerase [Clostridium sp. CCUG 7971]MBO3444172.1 diaminopimelate epimerase [Clostridium sp. CCUG 7971]
MKFWKLHGIGNDFIAIDKRFDQKSSSSYSNLARLVCHRRFSVGADGLLIVKNSNRADVEMVYYNSDGSRAAMCGNGLRCFVKFVYDNNIVTKEEFSVETLDGIKNIKINTEDKTIKVNMGKYSFKSNDILLDNNKDKLINEKIKILDKEFNINFVLMGVPHVVILVDKLNKEEVFKYGKEIENHNIFPNKTNVNFVKINDYKNIHVHTWERGCGYTFGCGTGMSACAVICNYLNKVDKSVNVTSQGGCVKIDIEDFVYMTGPAVKICEGNLEV